MRQLAVWFAIGCVGMLLLPGTASAQASISGTVQDPTGGVLPGVTVEAASPALIEQVRSAVTDGAGRYSIVDLRPGTYTVTFTLPGFSTLVREGIELQGTFNAQVNAELRVGALEETVTVTGASPVVDVQSTHTQAVLPKEQLAVLPGSRTIKGRAAYIPGVIIPGANTGAVAHGSASTDSHTMIDGYKAGQHLVGRGTGQLGVGSVTQTQEAAIEELVYDTGAQGAEFAFGGVRMNMIPKEGGNRFSGEVIAYGSNQHFESNNLGDLQTGPSPLRYVPQLFFFDFNPVAGGPIREDKLWYFGSVSGNRSNTQQLDIYFKDGHPTTPKGKGGQPADTGAHLNWSETIRVTHQVTPRHKLRYSFDNTKLVNLRGNYITGATKASPEASWRLPLHPTWLAQAKYSAALTNRLLIEAGYGYQRGDFRVLFQPENPPTAIAKWDLLRGFIEENHYINYHNTEKKKEAKAAVSYVTGSHSLKVGFEKRWATALQSNPYNGDIQIRFTLNNAPYLVQVTNGSSKNLQAMNFDGGAYVQDQWRIGRFTFNLGARWDHFNASIPAQSNPASNFTPAVSINDIKDVPNWHDFSTRTGVAWDVFGNGKTAVKAFAGRYVAGEALSKTAAVNPIYSIGDVRSWRDLNGDGTVINADLTPQYAEIGRSFNAKFGTAEGTTKLDPSLRRDKNWTYEVTVQHELFPRVAVGGGYYRRRFFDLFWTDNRAHNPEDWTPFTWIGPRDPRLPNGGGEEITLYNLDPAKIGLVDNFLTNSDDFRIYDGFELTANLQLPKQGFAMTSWTTGKTRTNSCVQGTITPTTLGTLIDNPNNLRFCDQTTPFRHIYKLSGGVPLPYNIMISGNFQLYDTPGAGLTLINPYFDANSVVNAANAGRTITGGQTATGSIGVNLLKPNTIFQEYYKIVDVRFAKTMTIGRTRTTALAEFDNIFNIRSINSVTQNYGLNWLRPTAIQRGRNIRFGIQMSF